MLNLRDVKNRSILITVILIILTMCIIATIFFINNKDNMPNKNPDISINTSGRSLECFSLEWDSDLIYEKISINKNLLNINSQMPDIETISKDSVIDISFKKYKPSSVDVSYELLIKDKDKITSNNKRFNVPVFTKDNKYAFKFTESSSSHSMNNIFCRFYRITATFEDKKYNYAFYAKDLYSSDNITPLKGIELYIWKNKKITGNNYTYFTVLLGTNRDKLESEIYNLNEATNSIDKLNQMLSAYSVETHLTIFKMNEDDFTYEKIENILNKIKFKGIFEKKASLFKGNSLNK